MLLVTARLSSGRRYQLIDYGGEVAPTWLRRWIEKQFGTIYSLTGAYDLLHRLGYSWLMPRPRHAKASKEAQEEFKKKRPRKSK